MKNMTNSIPRIVLVALMFIAFILPSSGWANYSGFDTNPVVNQALQLAHSVVGKAFAANAHGDPQRSNPPESFTCASLVTWAVYEGSGRTWTEWRPTDTILDINGLNGRPALVKFFTFTREEQLHPGDLLYRSPHSQPTSGQSRPRDFNEEKGEPGFNRADPRHDYHHIALYVGHGKVIQAGGDRRGDIVIAGPPSYSVRITMFDPAQWAPEAGRPRRLLKE